ncbi:MAG: radical SAM family heme chaperone HemW [Actinobacteria bacterium]|nr:radical SAM family heme chaperone HemW [Actinomycetota bacterium]
MSSPAEEARVPLPAHLYVHVPLCRSKCSYCDFFSRADDGSVSHSELVDETVALLRGWLTPKVHAVPLETLYVGGGTPTVLGTDLVRLLREIAAAIPLAPGAEVTVEANPESLTRELADALASAGVTRVSVGVQSLDDAALRWLGRCHDAAGAMDAMRVVREAGMNLACDLIAGVPGMSAEGWRAALESVVGAGAEHVSVYPLTIEDGTPLASAIERGEIAAPDEDEAAEAMRAASEVLRTGGLERYEVANYALPGRESRHNSAYWTGRPYLGIGGGAHGMLDAAQARATGLATGDFNLGRLRYAYVSELLPDAPGAPFSLVESLTSDEAAREDAMLGMRMTCGIADELAEHAGVVRALGALAADGLVLSECGRWRPTERGWLFGNEVFGRLWSDAERLTPPHPRPRIVWHSAGVSARRR